MTQFMRSGQDEDVVTLPAPNRQDTVDYECPRQVSTVRLIREAMPAGKVRVLAGVARMTARIANELFWEIAQNLQKFISGRSRPRPSRPKPKNSHAYQTTL